MRIRSIFAAIVLIGHTAVASAADVTMGFGLHIAPYAFAEQDRGLEVDIAREALAFRGHRLIPHYYPLDRLPLAFRFGRIDASMMDLGEDLSREGGFYAEPAVYYDNVLVSLADRAWRLDSPNKLSDKVVIGFAGAGQRYADWVEPALRDGLYFENNDQELQVLGLYRGHFDVMLTDRYIFHYFAQKLARERNLPLTPVTEYRFTTIEPDHHRPVFRDPSVRDDFNAGLAHLRETGRFKEIYDSYLNGQVPVADLAAQGNFTETLSQR